MSSNEDTSELKAGHAPAVKVGGMRVTQHKSPTVEKPEPPKKEAAEGEEGEEEVVAEIPPKQQLVISGVVARGDADFPAEAIQSFHNKPEPSHNYRSASSKPTIIHQPRK